MNTDNMATPLSFLTTDKKMANAFFDAACNALIEMNKPYVTEGLTINIQVELSNDECAELGERIRQTLTTSGYSDFMDKIIVAL